jgi:hypothetical protein
MQSLREWEGANIVRCFAQRAVNRQPLSPATWCMIYFAILPCDINPRFLFVVK